MKKFLKTHTVTMRWENFAKDISVRQGLGFQAVCARNKTPVEFDCREADCGICIIKVLKGSENLSVADTKEKGFLAAMRADENERLACQCRVFGDVTVEVDS